MSQLKTLFFDLDGTMYPNSNGIWDEMSERIHSYMREKLGIPAESVSNIRQNLYEKHGTSLRGLQVNYAIDAEEYLDYIHNIPLEPYIQNDPELRKMLLSLPYPKWIFTNADRNHATQVLNRLGVFDLFDGIIDIIDMDYLPKPNPEAYQVAITMAKQTAENSIFIEDSLKNLIAAKDLGWHTIRIEGTEPNPAVDFEIDSLHQLPDILATIQ